jgi:2-aminoadipate transaminase
LPPIPTWKRSSHWDPFLRSWRPVCGWDGCRRIPNVIKRLIGSGLLDSGGGLNPFTSAIVRELIETGDLGKNVDSLIRIYRSRLDAMGASLSRELPQAEFKTPQGGFFYWVRLPGVNAEHLQQKASAFDVGFRPGVRFSSQSGMRDYMRLCYAFYDEEKIEEAVRRLGRCLQVFL